ncbi:MAG: valine--pyruvate transaminase [Candidatus Levybacteria bacterium]|nr:valine--pyruvate transaminase [Candidatus Levybacteria bacterium]
MKLSNFGEKLTSKTGILQLMDDLGKALSGKEKIYMLGGGNPAHIPEIEQLFRKRMQEILDNKGEFEHMMGNYTTSQGDNLFIDAVVSFFKKTYGWKITNKNICVLGGGQTTFFFLFNMLAGKFRSGEFKKILFPLVPEYIGYTDQGIANNLFTAQKPLIKFIDNHTFKYFIDFKNLNLTKDISAICVSRPTNPTGNVVTDEEVEKLSRLAKKHNTLLMIDNAYGAPFPGIIFTKTTPIWDEHIVYSVSLSKLGLPSTRTSIVVANEEIIEYLTSINAIVSLTAATVGQHIVTPLLQSGEITKISENIIRPFYQRKSNDAILHFQKHMNPRNPYYLHKSEGALFLWLWCKNLPITSMELYERLKKKKVLVVPGEYFFPGYDKPWKHKNECVRITYSQNETDVKKGLEIIAETVNEAY